MGKKHRLAKPEPADLNEDTMMRALKEPNPNNEPLAKPKPSLSSALLSDVRAAFLRLHADTSHNIAELEAWRNEIDATIAFLKANRSR